MLPKPTEIDQAGPLGCYLRSAGALLRLRATVNKTHLFPWPLASSEMLRRAPAREGVELTQWTALTCAFRQPVVRGMKTDYKVERAKCPFRERPTAGRYYDQPLLFRRPLDHSRAGARLSVLPVARNLGSMRTLLTVADKRKSATAGVWRVNKAQFVRFLPFRASIACATSGISLAMARNRGKRTSPATPAAAPSYVPLLSDSFVTNWNGAEMC